MTASLVSVQELRHPLSRKAERLLHKAQDFTAKGDHVKAIQTLQEALHEESAVPYARSLLGLEYLKQGNPAAAVVELTEAVQLLPFSAVNHSNGGYALYLLGNGGDGREEIERAFHLDKTSPQVQFLMGSILLEHNVEDPKGGTLWFRLKNSFREHILR